MAETELDSLKKQVAALSADVAELRAELTAMGDALKMTTANTTQHIRVFYNHFHDYLMPVVHKVLPRYEAAKRQIDAILKRRDPSGNSEKNS